MRLVKTIGLFLIVLASVLVGITLFLHNDQMVSVNLVWLQTPEAAIAVWLMVFFAAGLILGVSVSFVAYLWVRGRTWGLRRKVRRLETQVANAPTTQLPSQS